MRQAIALARRGEGHVEPNPMVGCVIAHDADVVGLGWHRRFGGAHAEVEALAIAGRRARGATMYVTLEPCCHHGKTAPCTEAIIKAEIGKVVLAARDPFPAVDGGGIKQLRNAGIEVVTDVCEDDARDVLQPYLTLTEKSRPWVIAKWAMTLDGKIASRTGDSRWISSVASRQVVHQLRARVDGILVGRGTAAADDPELTARTHDAGLKDTQQRNWPPRTATRIVLDRQARLSVESKLVRTAKETPVLICVGQDAEPGRIETLQTAGCEIWQVDGSDNLEQLLAELGRRQMTNLLVEGGGEVLGALHDLALLDECHVFIAPKLSGGGLAPSPLAGLGHERIEQASTVNAWRCQQLGGDIYLRGRITR